MDDSPKVYPCGLPKNSDELCPKHGLDWACEVAVRDAARKRDEAAKPAESKPAPEAPRKARKVDAE